MMRLMLSRFDALPSPLPATLVDRGHWRCLRSEGRQRPKACLCVYYEEEPGRRSAAKLLSKDEARRIAANVPSYQSCWAKRKLAGSSNSPGERIHAAAERVVLG